MLKFSINPPRHNPIRRCSMKRSVSLFLGVLFVLSLTTLSGCKKDPKDPEDRKAVAKEMAAVITDNKDDCDAMGEELMAFIEDNEEFLKEATKEDKEGEDEESPMDEEGVEEAVKECFENEKVQKAFEKMAKIMEDEE
jgi:hypothetical protein